MAAAPATALVDSVVFDLGNVFLELDFTATARAFAALGCRDFSARWTPTRQSPLFEDYERGQTDTAAFRAALRAQLGVAAATDAELDAAWGAMLVRLDAARLQRARALRPARRIFLLSNTNEAHLEILARRLCPAIGLDGLEAVFERCHYSCRMGARKPEPEIYRQVLQAHGLAAARTLFVDDLPLNVEAARAVGMQGAVLPLGTPLEAVLPA